MPYCLNYGLSIDDFYRLTLKEIYNFIKVHDELKESDLKEKASFDYNQAFLFGIATHIEPPEKYPTIQEAYYGIFKREEEQADWQHSLEQFKEYARQHNELRRGRKQ